MLIFNERFFAKFFVPLGVSFMFVYPTASSAMLSMRSVAPPASKADFVAAEIRIESRNLCIDSTIARKYFDLSKSAREKLLDAFDIIREKDPEEDKVVARDVGGYTVFCNPKQGKILDFDLLDGQAVE